MFKYFLPQHDRALDLGSSIKKQLRLLTETDQLSRRLTIIDKTKATPIQRIFIMGCGRSGTWLITALMSTFKDISLLAKELPVEHFGVVLPNFPTLVIKRGFKAHETVENIPENIKILYILRHPFDVLTSVNPASEEGEGKYYIKPHRWLSEMLALRYLIETKRSNTVVVTYEELVTNPLLVQTRLAEIFQLDLDRTPEEIEEFAAPPEARLAMHGLRKIDQQSLYGYKKSQEKIDYLRAIRPRLGHLLDWVSDTFGYDVSLE